MPGECIGPLTVSDTTPYGTRLTWKPPKVDGGSKVTHYVVERKELGKDNWVTVQSGCKTPTCELQGLTEGQSYHFRVAPCNDIGQGEWLTTTTPVIAKYPFGKHYRIVSHIKTSIDCYIYITASLQFDLVSL